MQQRSSRWRRAVATTLTAALTGTLMAAAALPAGAAGAATAASPATSGELVWGVKASFRSYVSGPIAHGAVTVSGAASTTAGGEVVFTQESTTFDAATGAGTVQYAGTVRFTGHDGALDVTLGDPRLELGAGGGSLVATVSSQDVEGTSLLSGAEVTIATLAGSGPWEPAATGIGATLTAAGVPAFAEFYEAGTALDPVRYTIALPAAPTPDPTTDPSPEPSTPPSTDPAPAPSWTPRVQVFAADGTTPVTRVADGDTIVVRGTGFDPTANVGGRGVPIPATLPQGVYVVLGSFADTWRPSAGAPSSARTVLSQRWALTADTVDQVPTAYQNTVRKDWAELSADGTFTATFTVALPEQSTGNLGIYTYPGGGVKNPDQELTTPLARADQAPTDPPADPDPTTPPVTDPPATDPPATDPGTDPAKPGTAGVLRWGVKESFRSYVTGPVAAGSIAVSRGATAPGGLFSFPQIGSTFADGAGTVSYGGTVEFSGHEGKLNVRLSDPQLRLRADGTGSLLVDVYSQDTTGAVTVSEADVVLATLRASTAQRGTAAGAQAAASSPWTAAHARVEATLTTAGARAFSGFYEAGTALDPVAFTVGSSTAPVEDTDPITVPGPDAPADEEPGTEPEVDRPVDTAPPAGPEQCTARAVAGATLEWGVSSAFTRYVTGPIAQGTISTSGVTAAAGVFTWAGGTGAFEPESVRGRASWAGAVTFTGHDGILAVTIANPRVDVTGSAAAIIADVTATDTSGASLGTSRVTLATADLSGRRTSQHASWTAAPARLTAAGAQAFAGFYQAGEPMAPLTVTMPLGATISCDEPGTLPRTGDDLALVGLVAAVLLGAGVVLVASSRRARTTVTA